MYMEVLYHIRKYGSQKQDARGGKDKLSSFEGIELEVLQRRCTVNIWKQYLGCLGVMGFER